MMKTRLALLIASAGLACTPAYAAIVGVADVDLTSGPFTYTPTAGTSFTFSYDPQGSFDPNPVLVQTSGTGETTAFGGFLGIPLQPSTFFTRANVEIGANTFPGFAAFPAATRIPASLSSGDLGLRYAIGSDFFYGYARIENSDLVQLRFQTLPNVSIIAGSVPEPATWVMMIMGFGFAGYAARRRKPVLAIA